MIEEADAGRNFRLARTVEVDGDFDRGLVRFARYGALAHDLPFAWLRFERGDSKPSAAWPPGSAAADEGARGRGYAERTMRRSRPRFAGSAVCGVIFSGSDDINRLQGGFLPRRREGVRGIKRRGYFTLSGSLFGDVTRGPSVCVAASGPQQVSANSAGSAVDLMEASFSEVSSLSMAFGRRRRRANARH